MPSYLLCEHIRAISYARFGRRIGDVDPETMEAASAMLRKLLMIRCPPPRRWRFATVRRRRRGG